jgi:hypothetical protein
VEDKSSSSTSNSRGNGISADFPGLILHLAATLPEESSVLLLYALLHKHPTFREYVVSKKEDGLLTALLLGLLHGLYRIDVTYPTDALYVLVICLLLLVQDPAVQAALSSLRLPTVPW